MPLAAWRSLLRRNESTAWDDLADIPKWPDARELVERDVRDGRPGSLILCNVDHMKRLNNEVGHVKGDELLRVVYTELHDAAAPKGGFVYRAIADFVVWLPGIGADEAVAIAEHVRERVPTAVAAVIGRDAAVTARFGVTTWSEENTLDWLRLVGDLEGALWHAPLPRNATVTISETGERTFVAPVASSERAES